MPYRGARGRSQARAGRAPRLLAVSCRLVPSTRSVPECLLSMAAKHTWEFKSRLRARAFGWRGSHLACQRLKEAVAEVKKVARTDPVTAGDGFVTLMERIWPAFQNIDTSSGALGAAVYWAQEELLPVASQAAAD